MTTDQNIATKQITPGAGVDPRKRIVPSKRVKAWHRSAKPGKSLRSFARSMLKLPLGTVLTQEDRAVYVAWFNNKAR